MPPLADGGVLAVFRSAHNVEYLPRQFMQGGTITLGRQGTLCDSAERAVITDEYQGQAVAAMSSKAAPGVPCE